MKAAQDIILAPVVTERAMGGFADKKYTFKVATDATKIDIARACEELLGRKGQHRKRKRPQAPYGSLRGLHR